MSTTGSCGSPTISCSSALLLGSDVGTAALSNTEVQRLRQSLLKGGFPRWTTSGRPAWMNGPAGRKASTGVWPLVVCENSGWRRLTPVLPLQMLFAALLGWLERERRDAIASFARKIAR